MSTAVYEAGEDGRLFVGWDPRECGEHRTVGDYRAWCYDCSEWCYSRSIDMACRGCEIVDLRSRTSDARWLSQGGEAPRRLCCRHDPDQHLVVATTGDPFDGGVIICHVRGCDCLATWDVPQLGTHREDVLVPSPEDLARLRDRLQTGPGEAPEDR